MSETNLTIDDIRKIMAEDKAAESQRQENLREYQKKVNALKDELNDLQAKIEKNNEIFKNVFADKQASIDDLFRKAEEKMAEAERINGIAHDLAENIKTTKTQLDKEKDEFEIYRNEQTAKINSKLNILTDTEKRTQESIEKLEAAQRAFEKAHDDHSNIMQSNAMLTAGLDAKRSDIDSQVEANKQVLLKIKESKEQYEHLVNESRDLVERGQEERSEALKIKAEIKVDMDTVLAERAKIDVDLKKLEEGREEVRVLKNELAKKIAMVDEQYQDWKNKNRG